MSGETPKSKPLIRHYIAGEWAAPRSAERIAAFSPVTGELVAETVRGDVFDVAAAVQAAARALPIWSATPMEERLGAIETLAGKLDEHREELAVALLREIGVPISFARQAQVGVAIADLHELARAAREHSGRVSMSRSLVISEPVGVVAAITPWNFPLHQIVLKVGAALLAGCTVVLKPSEVSPLSADVLTRLIHSLELPPGTCNVLYGDGPSVGSPLCEHPDVDMITFTGSRAVGERIAESAAKTVKKVALELGGKSAAIILDDAPVDRSASQVIGSCFANTGQTCAALSRALVPRSMLEDWQRAAVEAAREWRPSDPALGDTRLGPLASTLQRERVREHLRAAVEDGARVLIGGLDAPVPDERGAWVAPTVLADVTPEMRIFRDEVFGPVLAVTPYDTVDEAIALANDSDYGLSGGVWSEDPKRALDVALRIKTGTIGINGEGLDVGAPFGGVKQSGIGRECGVYGFQEFLETKTVMGAAAL